MWGLETHWRLRLSEPFASDVLVFHEHWIGLILTLPFLAFGWRQLPKVSWRAWASILTSGVLGSAIGTICFTQALTMMNPSVANLLLNLQPIVSVAASSLWLRERPRGIFFAWALVAIVCGVVLGWDPEGLKNPHVFAMGLVFLSGTILSWGLATTAGRGAMLEIDYRTAVTLRYAIGAVSTSVIVLAHGSVSSRLNLSAFTQGHVVRDMASLIVFAAVTPTFVYFAGLARTPGSIATFAEMAQTFAALFITWWDFGNALTWPQVVSGITLLFAVSQLNHAVEIEAAVERPDSIPVPSL
jgi:drug/metabolite transporter (DMT)-like permease